MAEETTTTARTVVALFDSQEAAERAAEALGAEGVGREAIDIIAGHELSHPENHITAVEDSEGKVTGAIGRGLGMGSGIGALAGVASSLLIPGVGPLVLGGAIASTFLGAGLGGAVGGVMAGLMKAGVDESNARLFEAALRHGGVVVTVNTDEANAQRVVGTLAGSGALDMDQHTPGVDSGVDRVKGSPNNRITDTHQG